MASAVAPLAIAIEESGGQYGTQSKSPLTAQYNIYKFWG